MNNDYKDYLETCRDCGINPMTYEEFIDVYQDEKEMRD
jgi:uncharacterized short protein YbdD (DUF466 family)